MPGNANMVRDGFLCFSLPIGLLWGLLFEQRYSKKQCDLSIIVPLDDKSNVVIALSPCFSVERALPKGL